MIKSKGGGLEFRIVIIAILFLIKDVSKDIIAVLADEDIRQSEAAVASGNFAGSASKTTNLTVPISAAIFKSDDVNFTNVSSIVDQIGLSQPNESEQDVTTKFIHQVSPTVSMNVSTTKRHRSRNYASYECAKVIESNPEAKKTSHIINEMIDEYMLNPCKAKIWFVIELCEKIQATQIEIANYELYSSTPKDFTVYFSDIYPALDWKSIGHFTASDARALQAFDLDQIGFGKYIRVEQHSHYGNEHYCVISEVKVYGTSMMDYDPDSPFTNGNGNGNDVQAKRKLKRKTSAYRVYRNMMVEPHVCGLSDDQLDLVRQKGNITMQDNSHKEPLVKPVLPLPTQQPVTDNKPSPLKPPIFVELSTKFKALEISLRNQIEILERKLNEKREQEKRIDAKVDNLQSQFEIVALIMLAYYVYKLMLELL